MYKLATLLVVAALESTAQIPMSGPIGECSTINAVEDDGNDNVALSKFVIPPDIVFGISPGTLCSFYAIAGLSQFLARRIGGVHLLAQDEEPAQRPGCPFGCVLGWVRDVGFWLCHRNRSSHPRRSTTALWRSTPGASCESYWVSRGDAATGAIVEVEGKRIRTPGAIA